MNKRQAKKAFKKKYGYNPNKVVPVLVDALAGINWQKVGEEIANGFRQLGKAINEAQKQIEKGLESNGKISQQENKDERRAGI